MTEQPRFDDSSELVPHRNFTLPFNYVWERESERWIPMEEGFGGSYLDSITFNASAFIHKFGSNPSIKNSGLSVSSPETIWDGSNEYVFPSNSGEIMEIVSSDGSDTQGVIVQGLDENFSEKTWTGILTGSTPVNIGTWTRIFRAYNDGSVDFAGNITINEVGGSIDYAKILDGNNQTLMCVYTIPADKIGYLTKYSLSAQKSSSLRSAASKHVGSRTEFLAATPSSKGAAGIAERKPKGFNNCFYWRYAGKTEFYNKKNTAATSIPNSVKNT